MLSFFQGFLCVSSHLKELCVVVAADCVPVSSVVLAEDLAAVLLISVCKVQIPYSEDPEAMWTV